jgi:hypothetical protein
MTGLARAHSNLPDQDEYLGQLQGSTKQQHNGKLSPWENCLLDHSSCATTVMTQKNMVMSLAGPRIKNDCAGKSQQQFTQLD